MTQSDEPTTSSAMGQPVSVPARRGAKSTYSQDIADTICDRIANGETLRSICREDGMPAWRTVYDWMEANADFAARFAHARDLGADAIAQEALAIADTPLEGIRRKETADGVEVWTEDMLGHRKLQVETRLKLLAKWNPKKYGEKIELDHKGDGLKIEVKL